jgi:hypothetical protein
MNPFREYSRKTKYCNKFKATSIWDIKRKKAKSIEEVASAYYDLVQKPFYLR